MGQGDTALLTGTGLSLTFEDDIAPLFHEEGGGNTVFDGINLTFSADSASTVEAFEGSLSQVIADTTDGAADGNFVVEYTKTQIQRTMLV